MTDWDSWLDLEFAGRKQKVRLNTVEEKHRTLFGTAAADQTLAWESLANERALVEVIMEEDFGPDPICDEWPLITLGLFLQHSLFVDRWLHSYESHCKKRLQEVSECVSLNGGAILVPIQEDEFLPSLRDTISAFLELVSDVVPGSPQAEWVQSRLQQLTIPVTMDILLGLDDPSGARESNTVRRLKETLALLPMVFAEKASATNDQQRLEWFKITLPIAGQDYHGIKSAAAALAPSLSRKPFLSSSQTSTAVDWTNSADIQAALAALSESGSTAATNRVSLLAIALYWSARHCNDGQTEVARHLLAVGESRDSGFALANASLPLVYALVSDLGQSSTQICPTLRTLLSLPFLQNLLFRCPSRSDGWIKTSEGQLEKYGTRLEMLYRIARTNAASTQGEEEKQFVGGLESILLDLLVVAQRRAANVVSHLVGDDVATDEGYDAAEAVEVLQRLVADLSPSKSKMDETHSPNNDTKPLTLVERFEAANKAFAAVAGKYPDDVKLRFYGLFKQSTVGDVNTKRPWAMDFTGRAKWDAWDKLRGLTTTDAMTAYVEEWTRLQSSKASK